MKKIILLIVVTLMMFVNAQTSDIPQSDPGPAESSTVIDSKPDNNTTNTISNNVTKKKKLYQAQSQGSGYGWVEDIVGIDEEVFNYVDGSDEDLELYLKSSFFHCHFQILIQKIYLLFLFPNKTYSLTA